MNKILILFIFFVISCKADKETQTAVINEVVVEKINAEDVKLNILDFDGLEPYLTKRDDKTYVVNFWATWCAPCIKELPYFEELNKNYQNKNVEVLLVSLDFPNQYENKLKPFIKKHDLQSKILVLDDIDQNRWIPEIDENWDGAIPVTIIYNKNKREFYDRTFTYSELETELKQ